MRVHSRYGSYRVSPAAFKYACRQCQRIELRAEFQPNVPYGERAFGVVQVLHNGARPSLAPERLDCRLKWKGSANPKARSFVSIVVVVVEIFVVIIPIVVFVLVPIVIVLEVFFLFFFLVL